MEMHSESRILLLIRDTGLPALPPAFVNLVLCVKGIINYLFVDRLEENLPMIVLNLYLNIIYVTFVYHTHITLMFV